MIEQIDHVNIVVSDMEAMTRFYQHVLGMKVTQRVTISGDWIGAVVGLGNVVADVIYLEPPAGPRV
ncbi:MAG: VOC family protein, partial [Tepidisphaeraceae bacterium]